jgi:PAS domain S-box-containing protein
MNASPAESIWDQRALLRRVWPVPDRRLRFAVGICAFEIAFYLAYRYGMKFGVQAASPFWLPDSVLLCALLRSQPKHWWVFFLAPLPIRLFSEVAHIEPTWFLWGTYIVDSAEALVAAVALRRVLANPIRLETVRDFAWFGLIAVLLVPGGSAFAGAALRSLKGADYWLSWEEWFMGDAVTQLVATPAILYWVFSEPWKMQRPAPSRVGEAVLLFSAIVLTNYLVFRYATQMPHLDASRFYLPMPFLFWAALRFGMIGASAAVAIITAFAIGSALAGSGPFSGAGTDGLAFTLQNFLLLRAVPLYLVATSIEQRKNAEGALRESEQRFRALANAAPVLLWVNGVDRKSDFFNQGWLDFTGRTLEEEINDGWISGIHPEDLQHCTRVFHEACDARQPFELEYRLRHRSGEYRWIMDIGVPRYDSSGEFIGYIGSAVDISERKHAEESSRLLAHIQRLAIMGELTAAIAHEVRQPLSAIRTNADTAGLLLASPNPPLETVREILASIQNDDLRANEVLSRIRDFLRKREPETREIDVNLLVREAFRFVAGEALRRRVEIRLELAHGLPPVSGDRIQLQQVLLNLIVNGMDAMEQAPVAGRRVILRTQSRDGEIVDISVVDCGKGIASDDLPHLFDTFFTTRSDGMGLGLSIAWSIVVAHNGRISAENNKAGEGATFRVSLPALRRAAA